jgi:uncharacterized membrane protein
MASREDIRVGKGLSKKTVPTEAVNNTSAPTIVLPNAKRLCSILLFFIGSFAIGFGAGFGSGYASKECIAG